jgi:hypothetical protein
MGGKETRKIYEYELPDYEKIIEHPDGREFLFVRVLAAICVACFA